MHRLPVLLCFLLLPLVALASTTLRFVGGTPGRPGEYTPGSQIVLQAAEGYDNYLWYHNEQALLGPTGSTLTLPAIGFAAAGNYRVLATNAKRRDFSNTLAVNVVATVPKVIDESFKAELPDAHWSIAAIPGDGSVILECMSRADHSQRYFLRLLPDGRQDKSFQTSAISLGIWRSYPDGSLITFHAPYRLHADGTPWPLHLPDSFPLTLLPTFSEWIDDKGTLLLGTDRQVIRMRRDGTADPSFITEFLLPDISGGLGVQAISVDMKGRIMVGLNETRRPDKYTLEGRNAYLRLLPDGRLDTSFPTLTSSWSTSNLLTGITLYTNGEMELLCLDALSFKRLSESGQVVANPGYAVPYSSQSGPQYGCYLGSEGSLLSCFERTSASLIQHPLYFPFARINDAKAYDTNRVFVAYSDWYAGGSDFLSLITLKPADSVPTSVNITDFNFPSHKGGVLTLIASVDSAQPVSYEWLALDGQPLPADSHSSTLTFITDKDNFRGRYQLRVRTPDGVATLSNIIEVQSMPTCLDEVSGRALAGNGDRALLLGVSIAKNASGVTRGAGPALKRFGLTHALEDPVLYLADKGQRLFLLGDNWTNDFSEWAYFFPFDPGSLDAASKVSMTGGKNTLQLVDRTGNEGLGLIECSVGDGSSGGANAPQLNYPTNVSLRAHTGPGEHLATLGFILRDWRELDTPRRVLLRAIGPGLAVFGVKECLADPVLKLYDANNTLIASNDNWSVQADTTAQYISSCANLTGAFPLAAKSLDSALVVNLPPGTYTVQASGGEGTVLLELYLMEQE